MLVVSLEYLIIKIIHFLSILYRPYFNINLSFIFVYVFLCQHLHLMPCLYLISCAGMSLAQPCLSDGQQPVWLFWVALCCAAPAPKKICEDSNITANHSLPQQGSTCKPQPLPAVTQTESRGHAWHHPLFSLLNLTKRLSCIHTCNHLAQRHFCSYTAIHNIWRCTYMSILATSRMYVAMNLKKYKLIRRKC